MKDYHFQENGQDFGLTVRLDDINEKVKQLQKETAEDELGDANAFLNAFESEKFDTPLQEEPEMEDTPMVNPQEDVVPSSSEGNSNVEGFIANMRKESLGIMKALADNPDDAVYQFAKKIFQLADKAHEDQKEGKDINGDPKEGMQKPTMK